MLQLLVEQVLVDFDTASTNDQSSSGGDGRNNLSGDNLDLVSWSFLDFVVSGSEVRAAGHEVDVAVGIIILLELNRLDLGGGVGMNTAEFSSESLKVDIVGVGGLLERGSIRLEFLLERCVDLVDSFTEHFVNLCISGSKLGVEAASHDDADGSDAHEVHFVVGIEFDLEWRSLWRAPEKVALVISVVSWEAVQQLSDLVVEVILEDLSGEVDEGLVGLTVLDDGVPLFEDFELLLQTASLLSSSILFSLDVLAGFWMYLEKSIEPSTKTCWK